MPDQSNPGTRPLAETLWTGLQHPEGAVPATGLVAVDGDGSVVQSGAIVETGGGVGYVYQYATSRTGGGSLGKVVVTSGGSEVELFASLFGLTVHAEDVSPPAAGDEPSPWFGDAK
jgi:hypothetical protein